MSKSGAPPTRSRTTTHIDHFPERSGELSLSASPSRTAASAPPTLPPLNAFRADRIDCNQFSTDPARYAIYPPGTNAKGVFQFSSPAAETAPDCASNARIRTNRKVKSQNAAARIPVRTENSSPANRRNSGALTQHQSGPRSSRPVAEGSGPIQSGRIRKQNTQARNAQSRSVFRQRRIFRRLCFSGALSSVRFRMHSQRVVGQCGQKTASISSFSNTFLQFGQR